MLTKMLTTTGLVAALVLAPAERADADAAEFIGGAIIGGIIGHALSQGNSGTRGGTATRTVRPAIPSTQEGRETQTALNYFGFNAGVVDGQVGNGTRAAIERYQGAMGYPVNGLEFSAYQFDFLMDAYYWATNGGAGQTGLTNVSLLYAYRDNVQNGGSIQAAAPVAPPVTTVIVTPPATGSTGTTTLASSAAAAVPNLFAGASGAPSLANMCNGVMLQTSTNGGYATLANMPDPVFVLSEQYCVARTYAMAEGEDLMRGIVGLTQAQVTEQCGAFSTMLAAEIDRIGIAPRDVLMPEMASFAAGTGIPPAELSATARVCLSVGYTQDDMRMAVGSALVLTALGEAAYGELMGHHLQHGFGADERPDMAVAWYDASLAARLDRGDVGWARRGPGRAARGDTSVADLYDQPVTGRGEVQAGTPWDGVPVFISRPAI